MRYLAALIVALLAVCAVFAGSTVVIMRPVASVPSGSILHETFDPTGYDNTWTESVTYNNASNQGYIDEDYTTNPPAGAATGFTSQALRAEVITTGVSQGAHVYWTAGATFSASYLSIYVYVDSESLTNESIYLLNYATNSVTAPGTRTWAALKLTDTAGALTLAPTISNADYGCGAGSGPYSISAGTSYRVRIRLVNNGSSDIGQVYVNDTLVCDVGPRAIWASGTDPQRLILGVNHEGNNPRKVIFDAVDIDDTEYIN